MANPVKKVVGGALDIVGLAPDAPPPPAATPVAPVAEAPKTAPKSAVSLGGESQQAATRAQTRRRRAAGMQTGSRGVTTAATTERKRLLGQ